MYNSEIVRGRGLSQLEIQFAVVQSFHNFSRSVEFQIATVQNFHAMSRTTSGITANL